MSPEKPDEGNTQGNGAAATNPPASSTSGQPLSGSLSPTETRIAALEAQIKALQSGKDKGINKVQAELKPLLELAKYLPNVGEADLIQAQRNMVLDKLVSQQSEDPAGNRVPTTESIEVQEVAKQFGLDVNDPKVVTITQKGLSPAALVTELGKLGIEKAKSPAPTPTPAQLPVTQSGESIKTTMTDAQREEKAGKLNQLYSAPTANKKEIEALEKELGWA